MKFAITPCPNDTFSYFALISGAIKSELEFVFDDIEALNLAAEKRTYPITKLSFAAYLNCRDKYSLLDAGAALGIGTGPVLVGRAGAKFDASKPILVPGLNTTGALLLKFYAGKNLDLRPVHFREISTRLQNGEADFGVLIHEGRFVFASQGLELLADLGGYWTQKTGLPVPLGCICLANEFSAKREKIENLIRESVRTAFANPDAALPYVKSRAQYLEDDVLQKHIYAFVNKYSLDISDIKATLLKRLEEC